MKLPHTVTEEEHNRRIENWLKNNLPAVKMSEIFRLLKQGLVRVEGKRVKSGFKLSEGQKIRLPLSTIEKQTIAGNCEPVEATDKTLEELRQKASHSRFDNFESMIIFEDNDLLIINKPQGLSSQGGSHINISVDQLAQIYAHELNERNTPPKKKARPIKLVHRLDRFTSGLMILAKTRTSAKILSEAFKNHAVKKTYLAITYKNPKPHNGEIKNYLKKTSNQDGIQIMAIGSKTDRNSQFAKSRYETIDLLHNIASLVKIDLITGRMHQARVHMASMSCPIIGDDKYGEYSASSQHFPLLKGVQNILHLLCYQIKFRHPIKSQKITATASMPIHMKQSLNYLNLTMPNKYPCNQQVSIDDEPLEI